MGMSNPTYPKFARTVPLGKLRPVPLVITHTQPFDKRLALLARMIPARMGARSPSSPEEGAYALLADNGTLLHEMIHQSLFERLRQAPMARGGGAKSCA